MHLMRVAFSMLIDASNRFIYAKTSANWNLQRESRMCFKFAELKPQVGAHAWSFEFNAKYKQKHEAENSILNSKVLITIKMIVK